MLKAVLKCSSSDDCRIVNMVLAKSNVLILKTKERLCTYTYITIVVRNASVINKILFDINLKTTWEVQLVKVKQIKKIRGLDVENLVEMKDVRN